jgi:hypothetical protein
MKNNCKNTNVDLGGMNYRDLPKVFKEELDQICLAYPDSKITGRIQFTEFFGTREVYRAWLRIEDLAYGYMMVKYASTKRGKVDQWVETIETYDIDVFDLDELNKL